MNEEMHSYVRRLPCLDFYSMGPGGPREIIRPWPQLLVRSVVNPMLEGPTVS